MKLLISIILIGLSSSILLSNQNQKKDTEFNSIVNDGKKASKVLISTLGKTMQNHMKQGGPIAALDVCSTKAFLLTEEVNKKLPNGTSVKRISLKYRNPTNEPQYNEFEVLKSLEKLKDTNIVLPDYLIEKLDNNTFKFYKPLVIKDKVCLICHGSLTNDVNLKKAISSKYPMDNAVNYKMGDLRGAVVVIIKR